MSEQLTGPLLFLRYAWPCAEEKLHAEKMDQNDFDKLKWFIENGIQPDVDLLERCFQDAVEKMRRFSIRFAKYMVMWDIHIVREFWQLHRDVCEAVVVSINDRCVSVICGSKTFNALNNGLDLEVGDFVYVHQLMVIEKAE